MDKVSKSSLKNMSLKDIFREISAIFYETDISNFCDDIKVINRFITLRNREDNNEKLLDLLIENEDKIDKEKLVFNIYLNYCENIPQIEQTMYNLCREIESIIKNNHEISRLFKSNLKINNITELKKFIIQNQNILTIALKSNSNKRLVNSIIDRLDEIARLESELEKQKELKTNAKRLLKDTDVYIDESSIENNHISLKIYSSKEEYEGKRSGDKKKKARLDKIDRTIGKDNNGLMYVLQPLILSDLEYIMPEATIGMRSRENILLNSILSQGKYSYDELAKLKTRNYEEYDDILQKAKREIYLSELRQAIINNAKYIDIDKMFLIAIYRFEEYIEESKNYQPEYYKDYRNMVFYVMNQIENQNVSINGEMQRIVGGTRKVDFSFEDAEKFMGRLTEKEYVTKGKVEDTKNELLHGNKSVKDIPSHILPILDITNEELDQIINISTENTISIIEITGIDEDNIMGILNDKDTIDEKLFEYIIQNKKISIESVIELYTKEKINSELIKKYAEYISDEVTINKINDSYKKIKGEKDKDNQEETKLNSLIDIYKVINYEGKSIEEQEEASNEVMYQIAEDFEDEEDVLFYYNKGLVTLGIVAEWCGESTIEKLYNESKISKEDLINLSNHGKISSKLVEQILLVDDIQYDELMDLIIRGSVSEQKIVDLYMQGKIFDVDFEEMLNNGIISHEEYFTATELRTQEKLEENSKIKLAPILKDIPDKKSLLFDVVEKEEGEPEDWFTGTGSEGTRNVKSLIDPGVRYEFLKMLGAMQAEVLDIDETNAFYNYEFFVIPNSNGEIDLDSVVIAERFYVDKETKDRFATDNATYFFQYKDLMVNSNMSKNEMTKERDKIVFRASHRSGIWAVSVLQKLAQTMLSTKFKECTTEKEKDERAEMVLEQLHRILTPEQIKDILDLTGEIDDEEKYTYEIIDGYNTRKDSNKKISDEGFGEL